MRGVFHGTLTTAAVALSMFCGGVQSLWAQDDAVSRLRQEVAANPQRLDLALELGNAAVGAGDLDLAIASFRGVLEYLDLTSRGAGDVYLRLGETYRRKGDAAAAIASLTRASELLPDQPIVVGTLALVLDGTGRKDEAERAYRATLLLDADNTVAMNNLAFLLAERGEDLDEAQQLAKRAMELEPEDADLMDTAGWVQWKRKEIDGAIGLFAKALEKAPGNDGVRQHLLMALEGKRDRNPAMDELKQLLAVSSDSPRVGSLLRVVEK